MSNAVKLHDALLKTLAKTNASLYTPPPIQKTTTGILSIDALFRGGLPQGRVIELYGQNNSGKSTTAMIIARQYMRLGKRVILLDAEHTFDPDYALKFGMDVREVDAQGLPLFEVMQADTAEQWLDALREVIQSRLYDLIIIDTLAKFAPRVEFESSIDKGTMGVFPRLMSRFFRIVGPLMRANPATLLIINQERLDIGNTNPYSGTPRMSPGGNSKDHEVSVKLHTLKPQDKRDGDTVVGLVFRFKVEKSKLWTPDIKAEHQLHIAIDEAAGIYEVDYAYELYLAGKHLGLIVDKDGQPYQKLVGFFDGVKLGNGEKQILEFLDQPSDTRDHLEAAIYERLNQGQTAHAHDDQSDSDSDPVEDLFERDPDPGDEPRLWDLAE